MEFFRQTEIDFMAKRPWASLFSVVMTLVCLLLMAWQGVHLGLDFTGGAQMELHFEEPTSPKEVRDGLQGLGWHDIVVQNIGTSRDVLVRSPAHNEQEQRKLQEAIVQKWQQASIHSQTYIGPQMGTELLSSGLGAIAIALLVTLIYIALRFEWRFALSAVMALIHDPVLIMGVFSVCHIEFDLITLAALLTVLGFSLNDTIVVYDRVRENCQLDHRLGIEAIINDSINQTLSRTIMTSGLTLVVVLALLFFGGSTLFSFALALAIGILIGTYSSIYVAGTLAVAMGLERHHLIASRRLAQGAVV